MTNLSVMPTSAPCRSVAPTIEKLLYDRKSAAYVLSVSLRALDYLIANKQIKIRRIGGKVLIHANELKRFAAADHCGRLAAKAA